MLRGFRDCMVMAATEGSIDCKCFKQGNVGCYCLESCMFPSYLKYFKYK